MRFVAQHCLCASTGARNTVSGFEGLMRGSDQDTAPEAAEALPVRARRWPRWLGVVALVLGVILIGLWLSRERIASNVIGSQLSGMGLPATYRIERIGGTRQVITDVVIGDPRRPDMTIERAEVTIGYGLRLPYIAGVKLVRPRLYGTYNGGKLSFGSLDKVLFAPKPPGAPPSQWPDLDLALVDGRMQLLTEYGAVGAKADGKGNLRSGFGGKLAAVAPQLMVQGCTLKGASLFGDVKIVSEAPRFTGPVRMSALRCAAQGLAVDGAALQLDARADKDFKAFSGDGQLRSRKVVAGGMSANSLALDSNATWRDGTLAAKLAGDLGGVQAGGVAFALLGLDGDLRARDGFATSEFRGSIEGSGVMPGPALDNALASAERSTTTSLLGPMLAQMRAALQREKRGSRLSADVTARRGQDGLWSLVVPSAMLRGGSGAALVSLSRFQLAGGRPGAVPLLSGNFATGGPGLPQLAGRMERGPRGEAVLRARMAPYRAGGGSLELPELALVQAGDGSLGFAGEARLSGALPGGFARNLVVPLDGSYSARGELAVFRRCVTPRFDELAISNLVIEKRSVTLCPVKGGSIVRAGAGGLRIAAGATSLDVAGRLADTPIRIRSGPVGFAWPGAVAASALDVELGPVGTATRFRLSNLAATLGQEVSGTFAGAEAQLFSVPLDIVEASGNWRYTGGKLGIEGGQFRLLDRRDPDRFNPLVARDGALTLFANRIDASATMREPTSDREVVRAVIRHDLGSGTGHADLAVNSLVFDKGLQPATVTPLALGVVANVYGTVRGTGTIDWNAAGVTSQGDFSSDNLDLAAAFGPVKGLSGTVHFSDLLNLVTARDQTLKVASINPGIEVTDGTMTFALEPGFLLRVKGGEWPFLGGKLTLKPVDLNLGQAETRRYVLVIDGLDAAKFVEKMDLENISATGTFDGELPLVFDSYGGRIEGGMLVSRSPGGNLSYVGALTYKDLSAMANFAFDALKSLDYTHMTVGMDGPLQGEIVTRVRFDGVRQGEGAKRNIVTRAVADLPIQFNINIRAPFYRLITSIKAMYDPAFVKDPREVGLVDANGRPIVGSANGTRGDGQPVLVIPTPAPSGSVQPPASGNMR